MGNYLQFSQNVNFYPITAEEISAGLTKADLFSVYPVLDVRRYGAMIDGSTDDITAWTNAIAVAETAVASGNQGARITMPQGTSMISSDLSLGNRVTICGTSARGSTLKATAGFTSSSGYVLDFVNGTSAMFDTGLERIEIDASGVASLGCVRHNAMQENSPFRNVLFSDFTTTGLLITNGYGGAARAYIEDIEMVGADGATSGIEVDSTGIAGTFRLVVNGSTIVAASGGSMTNGILMQTGRVIGTANHFERVTNGFHFENDARGTLVQPSGHSSVTNVITLNSNFNGRVKVTEASLNSATRLVDDNTSNGFGDMTNVNEDTFVLPYMQDFADDDTTPTVADGIPWYRINYTGPGTIITGIDGARDGQQFNILVGESDNGTVIDMDGGTIRRQGGGTGDYTCEARAILRCYHIGGAVNRTIVEVVDP